MTTAKKPFPAPNPIAPPDSGNLPGFEFMSRVSRAAGIALAAQTEAANRAWADMQQGNYGFNDAARTWARMMENYFDVFVEFTRGPGYISRPAWLYFDYVYSRSKDSWMPDTLKAPAKMDRAKTPETEPAPTDFVSLGGQSGAWKLYKGYQWTGHELMISLDTAATQRLEPGTYISFVFAKGRSAEAPLAIIVLRVVHEA